jgi:hypothetical protein
MKTLHQPHPGNVVTTTSPASPSNRRPSVLAGLAASCLWVCSLGIGLHPLQAAFWGVYHLPHLEQLDFDGDQVSDLAMIQNGELWLRFDATRQTSDWQRIPVDVPLTPFQGGIRVASGDLNHDGFDDLVIAAAGANRVLVVYGQRDRLIPPRTEEIHVPGGPTGMDLFHSLADGSATLSLLALETPEPYVIQASAAAAEVPIAANRFGITIDGVPIAGVSGETSDFLAISLTDVGPIETFWLHRPPTTSGSETPILTRYGPADTQLGRLHKVSDVTLKRGIVGATATWIPGLAPTPAIVLWGGGLSDITVAKPNANGGIDLVVEDVGFAYHSVKFSYLDIPDLGPGSGRLLITHADSRTLSIYRWTTSGQLELLGSVVPPSNRLFLDASLLGDGGLMALFGDTTAGAGSTLPVGLGFFEATDAGWVLRTEITLPQFAQRPSLSRVLIYDRDPFADDAARELESLTAGDWARNAQISDRTVTVLAASFIDPLRGLGADTLQTLPLAFPPPRDAFALANQWEPDSSLFFGAQPAAPGPAAVLAQPPPGSHPGPVALQFAAADGVEVFSRVGNEPWIAGRGPYPINQTALVEYYGVDPTGRAGPRHSGMYIITQASHAPEGPLLADTDGDGLDDAWERLLFGGLHSSPDEDPDGDGFTTGQEYAAGTDPRDPESRPDGEPTLPLLLDMNFTTSGRLTLSWPGLAANQYGVDISTDLVQWSRSSAPTEYRDGAHHWEDPDPLDGTKFYRVERLP